MEVTEWTWGGNAIEKMYYLNFPREGDTSHHTGPQGEHYVLAKRQKQEQGEGLGQSLYWGLYRKSGAGQSKQFRIGSFE